MSSSLAFLATMRPAAGLGIQQHRSPPRNTPTLLQPRRPRGAAATVSYSSFQHDHYGGALVDEGMTVLRRRIREEQMAENNYEAPRGWAAWEKRYYRAYISDVSAVTCALQLMLMGTRPTVALAVAALVFAGVPLAALHLLGQAAETVLQHVS